ncbi:MAG TPA: aldo/keto reductase [Patescibacteria group bacterium]|nr:aldo/keto reductase [Patescibacteria group bacterium]
MLYRKYGKTNEMVSVLGFGCMRLPVIDKNPAKIDDEKAIAMIRHAIDAGVNYVDTAYPYHGTGFHQGGASEPFVARALKDGYRERVKLATKLPSWLIKTRADMDRYLNEQLERLETDVIDFYLVHNINKDVWPTLQAADIGDFLNQAIKDGKIRYAGFSFHDQIGLFKEVVDAYDWSFCQIQYNYLDETFQAGKEGLEYAADKGLGIAVMEPLRGGNLVRLPEAAKSLLEQAEVKRTPAEWALRWVWNHPEVSVVLSGMTTMDHVTENLEVAREALDNSLTSQELAMVAGIKKSFVEKIRVNCTACGYCMPCPSNINIPACFANYNDHWVFDGTPEAKYRYTIMTKFNAPASQCVECGECETHCPQGIGIKEELKAVVALFE